MTILKKLSFSLIIIFVFSTTSHGTLYDDFLNYQNKYKNDLAVVIEHLQSIKIEINKKSGELEIYKTDREELLYLKSTARFYTDQSISLSEFFEDIIEINVTVIKPDGKKIKLKESDFKIVDSPPSSWVFHDDDKIVVFDLKELGAGYRTIIEYTKKVKRPEFFDVFHFIEIYPLEKGILELKYPSTVDIAYYERSMEKINFIRQDIIDKKGYIIKRWEINGLPEYKTEKGSTNIKNHIPHIIAQIKSYTLNGETKNLIGNIEELHKYFQEFLLLKEDEDNRAELNKITQSLIAGKETNLEKMDTIFNWVQDNIKYIAFEDGINGYVPRACNLVMKNRYGDCKDMGNLLVEMLTFAGVENAYVAWVGTRDIPYLMSEIPSPFTCNHVICVVEKEGGGYYYLDATSSESSYILPPREVQEKELLIHLGTDKFELFKVPAPLADKNYIKTRIRFTLVEGDSIKGTGVDYYGGYEREQRTWNLKNNDKEDLKEYIKKLALGGVNRYTLKKYSLENLEDKKKELVLHYEFTVDDLFIYHEDELIINPTLFKPKVTKYNDEDYKLDRKKNHHRTIDYIYELVIPDNYKLKFIPDDVHFSHDLFSFDGIFSYTDNLFVVALKYQYHLLKIPPSLFKEWNEFAAHINKATIQNIVLIKQNHTD